MTATVPHVDAIFGGRPVRFELHRDRETIDKLEAAVLSVSACWGRFTSGDWTMTDVRTVLALAHPAEVNPRLMMPARMKPPHGVELALIDRQIGARPLGTYAPLATSILTAALFGLPPAAAVFDERTALDSFFAPKDEPAGQRKAA